MTFVTAWLAVAGVTAAALPIIIHLLMRRRQEPVRWAAMRLLEQVLRQQRRRRKLEHLIVLALRCLVLALVGAAVAEPFLRGSLSGERAGGRVLLFALDDSLTSGLRAAPDEPTALETHIETALAILDEAAPADAVGVITAAAPARGVLLPPTTDHASAATLLRSLRATETLADIPAALTIVRETLDTLDEGRSAIVNLLGDFRRGSAPIETSLAPILKDDEADFGQREVILSFSPPATTEIPNVQVVAVEPLRSLLIPGQGDGSGQVTVRLARFGPLDAARTRVAIEGEGIARLAPREVRWDAGRSSATVDFRVEPIDAGGSRTPIGAGASGSSSSPDSPASSALPATAPRGSDRNPGGSLGITATIEPDALLPDDRFATVLQSRRAVRVALVDRRPFGADLAIERLAAGQWLARALRPTEDAPIELFIEDPTRLSATALRASDAVVVARPDLLTADGFSALREVLRRGGLVMVVPPGEATVHLWVEPFVEQLRLPWRVGIEPVDTPEGLALDERQQSSALLRLLEAELPQLTAPVRIFRRLPISANSSGVASGSTSVNGAGTASGATGAPGSGNRSTSDGSRSPSNSTTSFGGPGLATIPITPLDLDATRILDAGGEAIIVAATARDVDETPLPGTVVFFGFSPELSWTDLPVKPLMVPLVQELLRQGIGIGQEALRARVGERPILGPTTTALVLDGAGPASRLELRSGTPEVLERAGLYRQLDAGDQTIGLLAVNVDPRGGDTTPQSEESILAWLSGSGAWTPIDRTDPAAGLRVAESGTPIPGFLLALALACAIAETILSRRFSHVAPPREAEVDAPGGPRIGPLSDARASTPASTPTSAPASTRPTTSEAGA